ncbi:MAG: leucyl aminopeptidase family protein [Candidatus Liptonbacteria bacterium]|nr:leucyl aminopeptidase family protein [Candidatus Liptonbacteria bacterium]
MDIKTAAKPASSSALVFFLRAGDKIEKHDFFRNLAEEDKNYLRLFIKHRRDDDFSSCLLLPSGGKCLIFLAKENKKNSLRKTIVAMRRVISATRREKVKEIAVGLNDFLTHGLKTEETAELMATQFEMANFEFNDYKIKPKDGWKFVEKVSVIGRESRTVGKAISAGKVIGEEINKARTLSNTPGGDMTPARLAEEALKSGKESGFRVKVLKEDEIKKLKMGGVLGVAKGSAERPRFIIMEYFKGAKKDKPIVLVGKGVTFDTGGLNLKPDNYIYEMHMDMSGGAAVIHVMAALARLKVKKNIVGLVPAVENMPSGSSYHPGDLLRTMSGKTIEVLNTDAEGRVILADALEYSKKYEPQIVVDIATLTGAAMAALGQRASAIFSTDRKLEKEMIEAGEKTGDYLWPLPLWEEYEEEIKGTFGDFANIGKTRYGGAITAAVFLWQFVKDNSLSVGPSTPKSGLRGSRRTSSAPAWVHLDIAPRMTTIESDSLAKGAAGASIALLVEFLRGHR